MSQDIDCASIFYVGAGKISTNKQIALHMLF